MKKLLSFLLVILMLLPCAVACKKEDGASPSSTNKASKTEQTTQLPTDEQLIREKIELFLTSYNNGDMEAVMTCLTAELRNACQAMMNMLGGMGGAAAGFDINLSDLFSLGVSSVSGDFMKLKVSEIKIVDEKNAVATTTMDLTGSGTNCLYFIMSYENNGWYIGDMTDIKPTLLLSSADKSDPKRVTANSGSTFVDGVAAISYKEGDAEYVSIVNEEGNIIYTTDKKAKATSIGKGASVISLYDQKKYEYYPAHIVDSNGKVVANLEQGTTLAAYGEGYALLYQKKDSIDAVRHLYGIMDATGKWVQPQIDFGSSVKEETQYAGDGVFAIAIWSGYSNNDYIFWNAAGGGMFYLGSVENTPTFHNGKSFVNTSYGKIINPLDISNIENIKNGTDLPEFIILNTNGTYKEYDMTGKAVKGYTNGYVWYTLDRDEKNTYIEDITSPNNHLFTYNEYAPSRINTIAFEGEYGLVTILGADYNLYFTLIDKNGKRQFEPIKTSSYDGWSGEHSVRYSEKTIVFKDADGKYCLADEKGNVTVTDYGMIGAFSDGLALASFGKSQYDNKSEWFYINKNNEIIPLKKS